MRIMARKPSKRSITSTGCIRTFFFSSTHTNLHFYRQQEVLLSDFNERVTIRGIDDDGYLQVRSKSNPDKIFSIGDDGNTFDMMKGLIRHKY